MCNIIQLLSIFSQLVSETEQNSQRGCPVQNNKLICNRIRAHPHWSRNNKFRLAGSEIVLLF
jgi:hypothetical protein